MKCFEKIAFFIQPQYFGLFTVLRAPYRYKISRDQLTFNRYFINFFFYLKSEFNYLTFQKYGQIYNYIHVYLKLLDVFETNFFFKKKLKITLNFFFKSFFNYAHLLN